MLQATVRDAMTFLRERKILPSYEESGPCNLNLGGGAFELPIDGQLSRHYGLALDSMGPLYAERGPTSPWHKAFRVVDAFTQPPSAPCKPIALRGVLAGSSLVPIAVLDAACALCDMEGLTRMGRSDDIFRAVYKRSDDACTAQDLPEPYGKWLMFGRREADAWSRSRSLALQLTLTVVSSHDGEDTSALDLELSAFAPDLVVRLAGALLRQFPRSQSVEARLVDGAKTYLRTL